MGAFPYKNLNLFWTWGFPYPIPYNFIKLNPFMYVYGFGSFFHSALVITICTLLLLCLVSLHCPVMGAFPYKNLIFFFFGWKWGFPYPIPSNFIKLNPFMWVYEFGCFFHSALAITICSLCSLVPLWVNVHIKI